MVSRSAAVWGVMVRPLDEGQVSCRVRGRPTPNGPEAAGQTSVNSRCAPGLWFVYKAGPPLVGHGMAWHGMASAALP